MFQVLLMVPQMTIEEIIDNFEVLADWEDRYRYIIELGRTLEPLRDDERTPETKVRGCASQVWLVSEASGSGADARLSFRGDSDAHIVRGLIAILFALYSGQTAKHILNVDEKAVLAKLGLNQHLSPQRSNGLASMVLRIKSDAAMAAKEKAPSEREPASAAEPS
jgi:cysteine desulfuration protein SufE